MFIIYKYMHGINIKLFCIRVFIIYENMKQTKADIQKWGSHLFQGQDIVTDLFEIKSTNVINAQIIPQIMTRPLPFAFY